MKWFPTVMVLIVSGAAVYGRVPSQRKKVSDGYSSNGQGYENERQYRHANAKGAGEEVDLFGDVQESPSPSSRLFVTKGLSSILAPPTFAFFAGDSSPDYKYEFEEATKILTNPKFDNSKPTLIYIHGFMEGLFSESVKRVVEAYTQKNDHNIVVLDWQGKAVPPYFFNAVPNLNEVGVNAGEAILAMINNGLNVNRLHIVGHSLGGQMAGLIGRTIQILSEGKVILKRISALDPAYPAYYGIPGVVHLTANDAEYVDVLHTDAGIYGAPVETGTVDFWPNGGGHPQPGCILNVCSHQRSWGFWTESLDSKSKNQFNAIQSESWSDFKNNVVGKYDPNVVMGFYTPTGLSGSYYLRTNRKIPYALGNEGLTYE